MGSALLKKGRCVIAGNEKTEVLGINLGSEF